ncbi:MAG: SprB repeat-containing protein [Saprospiraceae bacterium]|nr:SprB repeat-containing protein [Saprospiraceae bacterium]
MTDVACFGETNGSISLSPTGGTAPLVTNGQTAKRALPLETFRQANMQ